MRLKRVSALVPLALTLSLSVFLAPFVSQQEPPWCFRFPGESTARCNYYSLQECLIGTRVIGGKCERYHAEAGQLTPGQQQLRAAPKAKQTRQPR